MIQCEVIKNRRSVRLFDKSIKLEVQQIYDCLEAATKAPSPYNKQPWFFRIIDTPDEIQELVPLLKQNQWVRTATTVVIVGTESVFGIEKEKNYLAIGAAIQNLLLEAQQRGISTCWIGECLGQEMEKQLHWPEKCEIVSMVAMGYGRQYEIKEIPRKNVRDVLK